MKSNAQRTIFFTPLFSTKTARCYRIPSAADFRSSLKPQTVIAAKEQSIAKLLKIGEDLIYDFATPVFAGNFKVGTVRLGLKRTKVTETIKDVLLAIFMFLGLSIFIADLVGVILANHFTKRVNRLRQASREVLKGNLDVYAGSRLKKKLLGDYRMR